MTTIFNDVQIVFPGNLDDRIHLRRHAKRVLNDNGLALTRDFLFNLDRIYI